MSAQPQVPVSLVQHPTGEKPRLLDRRWSALESTSLTPDAQKARIIDVLLAGKAESEPTQSHNVIAKLTQTDSTLRSIRTIRIYFGLTSKRW